MKIKKLEIYNFRGVDEIKLDFTGPGGKPLNLIVLTGKNGTGKTAVLEACTIVAGSYPFDSVKEDYLIRADVEGEIVEFTPRGGQYRTWQNKPVYLPQFRSPWVHDAGYKVGIDDWQSKIPEELFRILNPANPLKWRGIEFETLSYGMRCVFATLVLVGVAEGTDPRGNPMKRIYLIDEPTIHVHPDLHFPLLCAIETLVGDRQIIMATNSDEILDLVESYERFTLSTKGD